MPISPSNIPTVASGSSDISQSTRNLKKYTRGKVMLVQRNKGFLDDGTILFDIRPQITESRTTGYINEGLPMMPSGLVIYSQTESRNFSLTAKFVSRDIDEASANWTYVQLLKSYAIPEEAMSLSSFVSSNRGDKDGQRSKLVDALQGKTNYDDKKGNDKGNLNNLLNKGSNFQEFLANYGPKILELHGYDTFNAIPVVVQSYNIDYTDDVDYIHIGNGRQVPIFQTITINLLETHIIELLGGEEFNIDAFRRGEQIGY